MTPQADAAVNLLPRPRQLRLTGGSVPARPPTVRRDQRLPEQGYRLRVDDGGVDLAVGGQAGERHGRATLAQLARGGDRLPALEVDDWPDLPVRGVMLDISRDKVPTMSTLKQLITRLAGWKVNHVQLYTEHTYAYPGHRQVWQDADPLTAEEVAELDAHCRGLGVELTGNQNCLGHMERWLRHPRYLPLALSPQGWTDARGRHRPPGTLEPGHPGSLTLIGELLDEIVPRFASDRFHVGLDEPFELPPERSGDYLEYLRAVRELPALDGRQMLVWGDILAEHPQLLRRLPAGVTVCEWGYEADHPFDRQAAALAAAGLPFWLCPGTSSWNSLLGRYRNARENCLAAAESARRHGAEGYLNTDWGDNGHLQYLPVSEPGLAYGAAVSWCVEANRDLDVAGTLDAHAFDDPVGELGAALLALGDAYLGVAPRPRNRSALALPLYEPDSRLGQGLTDGLAVRDLLGVEQTVAAAVDALGRARPRRADGGLVLGELRASAQLVTLLCTDARARLDGDGTLASVPAGRRRQLSVRLAPLIDRHRELWLARNRRGGLDDSVERLRRLERAYAGEPVGAERRPG